MTPDPSTATVGEYLAANASECAGEPAISVDGAGLSWSQLAAEAGRGALVLADEVGTSLEGASLEGASLGGAAVGVLLDNSLEWAIWALAAASVGRVLVPINTKLTAREIAYQLDHAGITTVVTANDAAGAAARRGPGCYLPVLEAAFDLLSSDRPAGWRPPGVLVVAGEAPSWARRWVTGSTEAAPRGDTALSGSRGAAAGDSGPGNLGGRAGEGHRVAAAPAASDPLLVQYTSGTTANPKGVVLEHRHVLVNACGVARRLEITPEDRLCSASPFFHVAGTTLSLFLSLVSGAGLWSFSSFDPERVLETIELERITVYSGVDALFGGLLKAAGFDLRRLASVRTGWIAAQPEVVDVVHEEMGLPGIVNVYGLSEYSPNVTISDVSWPASERRTSGRPHSGSEVRIVDAASGAEVAAGTSGLIEVRGPCLMRGYLHDPEATSAALSPGGWLRTGDRGHLDLRGCLVFEGRESEMIRLGGENVAPAEIETVLLEHPAVELAAVFGRPDERLGEVPVAMVVLRSDATASPAELTSYASWHLASFKVPRTIAVVASLPVTGSQKIQRRALREHWERVVAEGGRDRTREAGTATDVAPVHT